MARYVTNFDDEYFGTQYKAGDELNLGKDDDEDRLAGAVTDGRLTKIDEGDQVTSALGAPDTASEPADEEQPVLSGMTKAELLDQARAEGVTDVTDDNNKDEIRAKIEAARG